MEKSVQILHELTLVPDINQFCVDMHESVNICLKIVVPALCLKHSTVCLVEVTRTSPLCDSSIGCVDFELH